MKKSALYYRHKLKKNQLLSFTSRILTSYLTLFFSSKCPYNIWGGYFTDYSFRISKQPIFSQVCNDEIQECEYYVYISDRQSWLPFRNIEIIPLLGFTLYSTMKAVIMCAAGRGLCQQTHILPVFCYFLLLYTKITLIYQHIFSNLLENTSNLQYNDDKKSV